MTFLMPVGSLVASPHFCHFLFYVFRTHCSVHTDIITVFLDGISSLYYHFPFYLLSIFSLLYMYVYVCMYVHMSAGACAGKKRGVRLDGQSS